MHIGVNERVDWLSTENVVAVITALVGVVATFAGIWYERRVPRRKRIGYRVQMDMPIGSDNRHGPPRANIRLGLFNDLPDMSDATLVLLRIENDGAQSITDTDYTSHEPHGLTAVFTERTVRGVAVTEPGDEHLIDHFTPSNGMAHDGGRIYLPRVPLNRGQHYKLLVLLSGGGVGSEVAVIGGIRDGKVERNRSTTVDDKPPLFSRPSRWITSVLTVGVVALASIIVTGEDASPAPAPPPVGCATGHLDLNGSTAFAPVTQEVARMYQSDCPGSTITVTANGSEEGLRALVQAGAKAASGPPALITVSDGQSNLSTHLDKLAVGLTAFAVVVNNDVHVPGLTSEQVRSIYRGDVDSWRSVGQADIPLRIVSRSSDSGTREVFRQRVLGGAFPLSANSIDCKTPLDPQDTGKLRCELSKTDQVLDTVDDVPGAIGYSDLHTAQTHRNLHALTLDGLAPSVSGPYPFIGVEYAYTYGQPPPGSLAASFLNYLARGRGQDVMRAQGHPPCYSPEGFRECQKEES